MLTPKQLRGLFATTSGESFIDRRDEAILRLFIDTACAWPSWRGLTVDDVDLDDQVAAVVGTVRGRRPLH